MVQARSQWRQSPNSPPAWKLLASRSKCGTNGLCVISCWIPLKPWHPDWQLFISAHLRAGRLGNGGGGPGEVGSTPLARGPLGKHARCLPTQIAFQKWKGSVQLRLEPRLGNDSHCPHTIKHPAPQGQGLSHKVDPTDFAISLSDPESAFPLEHVSREEAFSNEAHGLYFLQRTHSHTLPCRKRAACFWECFS